MKQVYFFLDNYQFAVDLCVVLFTTGVLGILIKYFTSPKKETETQEGARSKIQGFLHRKMSFAPSILLFSVFILLGGFVLLHVLPFCFQGQAGKLQRVQGTLEIQRIEFESRKESGYRMDFKVGSVELRDCINLFMPEERARLEDGQNVIIEYGYIWGVVSIYQIILLE